MKILVPPFLISALIITSLYRVQKYIKYFISAKLNKKFFRKIFSEKILENNEGGNKEELIGKI